MTPTVCAKVSRYCSSEPLSAAVRNHEARAVSSCAGRFSYPVSRARSRTVPGRKPPSR
ncbi:Uncharacterised protein [Mycobacteroides abscessus subsp. abscessus]|nr:Uncharacterised protein [Mycobacteroides abscessus subsp. abscessus]